MKKFKTLAPYFLIITLAFLLRFHRYTEFPTTIETADEIAWTWLGASLISEGAPTSWSYFSAYDDGHYIYGDSPVHAPFVRPAVDHPPLFSLIPGAFHLLDGSWDAMPNFHTIRMPMILMATVAVALFAYWTRMVLEPKWSLLATTLYAVIPTFVFASRVVVSENFLIILLLLTAILVQKWQTTSTLPKKQQQLRIKTYALAFILIGIASLLTKISGITIPITLLAYAILRKDATLIKIAITSTIAGVLALIVYAAAINIDLFFAIQTEQASRPIGLTTLYNRFFVKPNIASKIYYDGWIVVGFFGFIFALLKKELTKQSDFWLFSLLSVITTLGFIGVSGGAFTFYGWYSYPLFPFFVLFTTLLLKNAYKKYLLTGILWILLLPGVDTAFIFATKHDLLTKPIIRVIYVLGFVPLALSITPLKRMSKYAQIFLLVGILSAGIVSILAVDGVAADFITNQFIDGIVQ